MHLTTTSACLQARAVGDGDFSFKYIMIDKSKAERSAIVSIGAKFLSCFFHLLQDWERFLKSSDSGVRSAEDRHDIIVNVAHLKQQHDSAIYDREVGPCSPPRYNATRAHAAEKNSGYTPMPHCEEA